MALFVRTPDQAEVVVVEMVRLQSQELARRRLAASADDLRHGDLRVVVADPLGHAAEELERTDVALLERLGAFAGKRLAEEGVAVRQRHHAEHHLDLAATIDGLRLAEVELGFARRMRQRHEDFGRLLLAAPDLVADDRDPAGVAVFVAEPLEDPLARMTLLRMDLLVGLQNLVNDRDERPDLRLVPRRTSCGCSGGSCCSRIFWIVRKFRLYFSAGLTPAHLRRRARRGGSSSTCPCR